MGRAKDALIRPERQRDYDRVGALIESAFGQRVEANLVDALRGRAEPIISLVACDPAHDGAIVGHVLFTPVSVECDAPFRAMALGPIAVRPDHQRLGIGSRLIEAGLQACRGAKQFVVFVVGDPRFYQRFGFVPASRFGLSWDRPVPEEVFMVVELQDDAVRSLTRGGRGVVHYLPEFDQV